MKVSAIPPSRWRSHEKLTQGEPRFCDYWSPDLPDWANCSGGAEIELGSTVLCRECASDLTNELREAIEMIDARQMFNGTP